MDYRDFRTSNDPRPRKGRKPSSGQWWKLDGEDACTSITSALEQLEQAQSERITQMVACARLYGHLPVSRNVELRAKLAASLPALRERIIENVIQVAVDTAVSKVRRNRPRPYFLTSGGEVKLQRRAKKLNKFIEGVFYSGRVRELAPEVFRDACVFGTGVAFVYDGGGKVCFERVPVNELWVDELEAEHREPRTLHRVKRVDREVLAEMFPEHRAAIMDEAAEVDHSSRTISDLVRVRESWHLPSGPNAKDGRRMITLSRTVLLDEEWTRPTFPFAFCHWSKRLFGWWGQGGVEQQQNAQIEMNRLHVTVSRSLHLAGTFKILMEAGSKIVSEHLNNEVGSVVKFTGTPPQYVVPQVLPAEYLQRIVALRQSILEGFGVNQMAARAAKPAGLNSGKAIREYRDETDGRLVTPGEHYEQFHLDLARLAIETIREIATKSGSYKVAIPGKRFLETVDWKDVDLEDDQFTLQCFPVSSLPSDPAGRLQTIQEYIQAGIFSLREGAKLLAFPDLERVETLHGAQEEWIADVLERIWDDGEFTPPEPFMDLALAREMALQHYALGQVMRLEEERLNLYRDFIAQVDVLVAQTQADQVPPDAAPAADPLAQPEAPPTSDLLPVAAGAAA